jgi:hypothetical protein
MKTLTILFVLLVTSFLSATIIHVPADQATIQQGINTATNGDTVLVAEGTFYENINFMGKAITVASHFAVDGDTLHIANTIIDGSGATNADSASVVYFVSGEDTTSILMGFTITGGTGTRIGGNAFGDKINGGGVFCKNSSAQLFHNIIRDNTAIGVKESGGAGIYAGFSTDPEHTIILEHNQIMRNKAESTADEVAGGGLWTDIHTRACYNTFIENSCTGRNAAFGAAVAAGGYAKSEHKFLFQENRIIENSIKNNLENGWASAAVFAMYDKSIILNNEFIANEVIGKSRAKAAGLVVSNSNAGTIVKENSFKRNKSLAYSYWGAALFVEYSSNVLVGNNLFEENVSVAGPGLYFFYSDGIIRSNRVVRNEATGFAAGIETYKSNVLIENNLIEGNSAVTGAAGAWLIETNGIMQNNVVTNNSTSAHCGGIGTHLPSTSSSMIDFPKDQIITTRYHGKSTRKVAAKSVSDVEAMILINNTVCQNSATLGGGLFTNGLKTLAFNNIFYGNKSTSGGNAQIFNPGGNLTVKYCAVQFGWAGEGNTNAPPLFVDSGFQLSAKSSYIGAGTVGIQYDDEQIEAPANDFDGAVRPQPAGSAPDLGAYEHSLAEPAIPKQIKIPQDFATIQEGINAAINGDTVLVAEGTYIENINYKGKAITVASHYIMDQDTSHISKTIIDGSEPADPDSASTVLFVSGEDTTSVLTGLTITGGSGTIWIGSAGETLCGGGVFCNRSGARVVNNIIRDNIIFSENRTVEGAGIASEANGVKRLVIIEDNIIKDNHAESENANAEDGGLGIFSNCRIVGNLILRNRVRAPEFSGAAAMGLGQWDNMIVRDNIIQENNGGMSGDNAAYAVVMVFDASVEFINNSIIDNKNGGGQGVIGTGMFITTASDVTIKGNTFRGNTYKGNSFIARAILTYNSFNILIEDNLICDGQGVGALYISQSEAVIRNNTIRDNRCYYGTGISGFDAKILVENNTIVRNLGSTGSGGGYLMNMKSALLRNNIFSENSAGSRAAGGLAIGKVQTGQSAQYIVPELPMLHSRSERLKTSTVQSSIPDCKSVVLINNTIVNNKASNYGGGLFVYNWETHCINNIIWGNTAGTGGAQIWDPYSSMAAKHCAIWGGWSNGERIIQEAPLFLEDTFELSEESPCIGAGVASIEINGVDVTCGGQDCMGNNRPQPTGTNPDIGAYEHELGDPVTNITNSSQALPIVYRLAQNYPNPFNPTTTIKFDVPEQSHVTLTIYNLKGQVIRTLMDETCSAGSYAQTWDATNDQGLKVCSGVYIYRIKATFDKREREAFQAERKMLVLK